MKGQVTIEFILVLVVMLVILATVSLPTVERIEQDVTDTGTAVNLVAVQQRILNTAEELSMAGCNSHKTIRVFVDADAFNQAKVSWDQNTIGGQYYQLDNTQKFLKNIPFPDYIDLFGSMVGSGYYNVQVTKQCASVRPSSSGCVGDGC